MRGLLDTSVFISQEQARDLSSLPDEAAISVMTLAELHVGVLLAKGPKIRARRLRTLAGWSGHSNRFPLTTLWPAASPR